MCDFCSNPQKGYKSLKYVFLFLPFVLILWLACGQLSTIDQNTSPYHPEARGDFRIMFYNCENLFDLYNDTLTQDDEFLPDGAKYWTPNKYYTKLRNISKVITAVGGWELPDIVGLCEVENRYVLEQLLRNTQLKNFDYQIIHKESPDGRGIDVAMLYRTSTFFPHMYKPIGITYPHDPARKTRDVLYVRGETLQGDTLHVFVNHWPSRWGGQMESEENRIYVASVLRHEVDSIFTTNKAANIVVVGDLNDYPENISLTRALKAKFDLSNFESGELYNLANYLQEYKGKGTHKHDGEWGVLDQIIVSGGLLSQQNSVYCTLDDAHVFDADFLLEPDATYVGYKPFRTYIGYSFHGGFSDHLPVFLDIKQNTQLLNK